MSIKEYAQKDGRYDKDKADLVQTIIIIAGFAVAAIVAIGALSSVLLSKSQGVAECIAGANSFSQGAESRENCSDADGAAETKARGDAEANFGGTPFTTAGD